MFKNNRIKELRLKKGLTVAELGQETNIPQSSLTSYENGNSTPRGNEVWLKLADFFQVSPEYVMGVKDGRSLLDNDKDIIEALEPIEIKIKSRIELLLYLAIDSLDKEDKIKTLAFAQELMFSDKYDDSIADTTNNK